MAIYSINGNALTDIYDTSGTQIDTAYDISGDIVYSRNPFLKVMTYNVQWFTNLNSQQAMQEKIINDNGADIIGLQELTKTGTVSTVGRTVLSDYALSLSNHSNYLGMAAKLPLSNIRVSDYENQDPYDMTAWNETRAYMMADITFADKTITWINTHFCTTNDYKYLQMAELLELAREHEYVIITGDFNSYVFDTVASDEFTQMYGLWYEHGFKCANHTQQGTYTKTWTSSTTAASLADFTHPTDDIIVSDNIDIISTTFDTTKLNYLNGQSIDHIPIVVQLSVE